MKMRRCAARILAVACMGLALDAAMPLGGAVAKPSCGGFKPETRTLCWRNLP